MPKITASGCRNAIYLSSPGGCSFDRESPYAARSEAQRHGSVSYIHHLSRLRNVESEFALSPLMFVGLVLTTFPNNSMVQKSRHFKEAVGLPAAMHGGGCVPEGCRLPLDYYNAKCIPPIGGALTVRGTRRASTRKQSLATSRRAPRCWVSMEVLYYWA